MERVALESLRAMAAYRDALERTSDRGEKGETAELAAMKAPLSPFSTEKNILLDLFSPEGAFPFFHSGDVPAGSWMTTLLGAMPPPLARRAPEVILTDALRLSALALAAEAWAQVSTDTGSLETDLPLPDSPAPFLLLISDVDHLGGDSRETPGALIDKIENASRKAARVFRLPNAVLLPALARRVYAKWGIPVSMTGSIACVFSSSLIRGLGALALGFSVVSIPGYPIMGSPLVERYMTRDLKSRFGHGYLALPPQEDPCEAILGSLAL
jgi:hypothetical protein